MKKYVYPQLPAYWLTHFARIGGSGLGNCLFVYAKAIMEAHKQNLKVIAPVWFNLSLGTYIRREKDKRHYIGLMCHKDEISGLRKLFILTFGKREICYVHGIYDFFKPLLSDHAYISNYICNHINAKLLKEVNAYSFQNCIALHIRLGDFSATRRVPMWWFLEKIQNVGSEKNILLFSDGEAKELEEILRNKNVKSVFFGNALADMIAMSRCEYIIGSDSSFSAWAAYLGQVPCCFYRLQYGRILLDETKQIVENE